MKFIKPAVLVFALLFSLAATAAKSNLPPTPLDCGKTPGFQVEAEAIDRDVTEVYVTFIGRKPTRNQAENALRECLAVAVKRDASRDILPTAWYRKRAAASKYGDDQIKPFGARKFLAYSASTRLSAVNELAKKGK